MKKQEFCVAFQLSKMKVFEVRYYTVGGNANPHFATSAGEFIRSKRDFRTCGQAQETVCKGFPTAYNFYKKWDRMHLKDLTDEEYAEMIGDLQALVERYNYVVDVHSIKFSDLMKLSKMDPKHHIGAVFTALMDDAV